MPAVVCENFCSGRIETLGPALGNANDEIYRGLLGLADDDMAELSRAGVI